MNDLGSNVKTYDLFTPQTTSGTIAGTAIDRLGFESGVFRFSLGTVVGSPDSVTATCTVTECDTSTGTFAAITGASVLVTTTGTGKDFDINFETTKRYIKGNTSLGFVGGSGNYVIIGGSCVLGNPRNKPTV